MAVLGVVLAELVLLALQVSCADLPGMTGPSPGGCTGVVLGPDDDLAAIVNGDRAAGVTFCLAAGVHRMTAAIVPKDGDMFVGEKGATITGAKLIGDGSWARSGRYWVASGALAADGYEDTGYSPCQDEVEKPCIYRERLFRDDVQLRRVMTLESLGPDDFYADYARGELYLAADPDGRRMELSSVMHAFISSADHVTIENVVVEKFAPFSQHGAVEINGSNWLIKSSEIRFNHAAGIKVNCCSGTSLQGNRIHSNGQQGIGAYATANLLVDRNELAFNNTDGFWVNDGENGGLKVSSSATVAVRDNYAHDNVGLGLWFDLDVSGATIERNDIRNNASDGIRYEISDGAAIRNNVIFRNGFDRQQGDRQLWYGAGLNISSSSDVQVYRNVVVKNDNGIGLASTDRGSGARGEHILSGVFVRDNDITQLQGVTGLIDDRGDRSVYTTNRFDGNRYHLGGDAALRFYWMSGVVAKEQWVAHGQDVGPGASFDTEIPADPSAPTLIVGPTG